MKHAPRGPVKGRSNPMERGNLMDAPFTPCTAKSKQSGQRCKRRPIPGGTVCVMHGGKAPQVQAKAQERLMALQPKAIQTLDDLLGAVDFPTVRLGAAKDVLDRTEGKAKESLEISGSLGLVAERLIAARKRLAANEPNP